MRNGNSKILTQGDAIMNASEIKTIIEANNNEYGYFGIRAMMQNPLTGENQIVEVDDILQNSYVWEDGETTGEELNGTCALKLNYDAELSEIDYTLKNVNVYSWNVKQFVLLGASRADYGTDANEIILENAVVLAAWDK
jgi:hypothetical protein